MTMTPRAPGNPEVVARQANTVNTGMDKWLPKYAKDADRPYEGDPWERQPEETSLAFQRFCAYRDMPPDERSIAECARRLGVKSMSVIYKMSSKHRWEDRAAAYDAYMAAKLRARLERRKLQVAEKHADQLEDALEVMSAPAREMAARLRKQAEDDGVTIIDQLDDLSLLKLVKAFSGELPSLQKGQRDALGSANDTAPPPASRVKAKGQLLRQIVGDPNVRAMVERLQFEVEETVEGTAPTGTDD